MQSYLNGNSLLRREYLQKEMPHPFDKQKSEENSLQQ
jgi:hypothetical protein